MMLFDSDPQAFCILCLVFTTEGHDLIREATQGGEISLWSQRCSFSVCFLSLACISTRSFSSKPLESREVHSKAHLSHTNPRGLQPALFAQPLPSHTCQQTQAPSPLPAGGLAASSSTSATRQATGYPQASGVAVATEKGWGKQGKQCGSSEPQQK